MVVRLPKHARIMVIPDHDRSSREYTISRGLVVCLGLLLLLLVALVIVVLISSAGVRRQAMRVPELQDELAAASARVATVQELHRELEQMRSFQERLLIMLGVEQPKVAGGDTLAGGAFRQDADSTPALSRVAALVMTPPPDTWPLAGYVTREFVAGDPARGVLPHHGIDLAAPEETAIRTAGKGRVLAASWDDFLGNFVEIQHGFGYVTVYGHCSRLAVQAGDRIDKGQVVGYLGETGQASAPHLHFEVWKEGEVVDPRTVLAGEPPR